MASAMASSMHGLRKILGEDVVDVYKNMIDEISGDIRIEGDMEDALYGDSNRNFDSVKRMLSKAKFSKNGTISVSELLSNFNSKFGTSIVDDGVESNILSKIISEIENRKSSLLKDAENKLNADGFGIEANAIFNAFRKQEQQFEEVAQVAEQTANEIVEANQRQEQSSTSTSDSIVAEKEKEKAAYEEAASAAEEAANRTKAANEKTKKSKKDSGNDGHGGFNEMSDTIDMSGWKVLRQVGTLEEGAVVTYKTAEGQLYAPSSVECRL